MTEQEKEKEAQWRQDLAVMWKMRCEQMPLKKGTKNRQGQLEAFLQGALAMGMAVGAVTEQRASQIGFLVAIDRGEEFLTVEEESSNG